jgi:antitoxin component YwqK of YwqJK toxin-antitoxin module
LKNTVFPFAIFLLCSLTATRSSAQEPRYTKKHFVSIPDTTEFKVIYPTRDGPVRTYISADPVVWDLDDDSTTFVRGGVNAILCIEGQSKNSKREGVFRFYLIDSTDHSKRYKIWEQTYENDKLNGQWRTYSLRGTLVSFQTFKDDSVNGLTRNFWIDGRTIMDEQEYFNGHNRYIQRDYYKNGKLESETHFENGKGNGTGRKLYENGNPKEEVNLKNGVFDGTRKYYYPNGQLWIEQTYRLGKSWTVIANYTDKGVKRDAGTLHDGNGTIIFYNDDGTVREVVQYVDGDPKQ